MLSCWLTWYVWFKVVCLFHVDQSGILFIKTKTKFLVLSLYPPCHQSHIKIPCYVSWQHDWALSNFVTHHGSALFMHLILGFMFRWIMCSLNTVWWCLFKKKREKERWKDGMPKKHAPNQKREKRWHAKEAWPSNKTRHENEHVFICALTWPVVNMIMHLWIQFLILQQIWAKQMTFYLIHRNSIYTIRAGEVK